MEKLAPENDMQELWELKGRVDSAMAYIINSESHAMSKWLLLAMLRGDESFLLAPENCGMAQKEDIEC